MWQNVNGGVICACNLLGYAYRHFHCLILLGNITIGKLK